MLAAQFGLAQLFQCGGSVPICEAGYIERRDPSKMLVSGGADEKNQFALEIDHFSECILLDQVPHTPGEEGLQDHLIIESIYEAAHAGRTIAVSNLIRRPRGSELHLP